MEDFEEEDEDEDKLSLFHITVKKTITTYIDVRANDMQDAVDMCLVGIGVTENGVLDARSDMEPFVENYGIDDVDEEILTDNCYEMFNE